MSELLIIKPSSLGDIVHGLQVAKSNDGAIVPGVMERGVQWLVNYQNQQVQMLKNAPSKTHPYKEKADNLDALVYMVLVDGAQDTAPCVISSTATATT